MREESNLCAVTLCMINYVFRVCFASLIIDQPMVDLRCYCLRYAICNTKALRMLMLFALHCLGKCNYLERFQRTVFAITNSQGLFPNL